MSAEIDPSPSAPPPGAGHGREHQHQDEHPTEQRDQQGGLNEVRQRRDGMLKVRPPVREIRDREGHGLGEDPAQRVARCQLGQVAHRRQDRGDQGGQRRRGPEAYRPREPTMYRITANTAIVIEAPSTAIPGAISRIAVRTRPARSRRDHPGAAPTSICA